MNVASYVMVISFLRWLYILLRMYYAIVLLYMLHFIMITIITLYE